MINHSLPTFDVKIYVENLRNGRLVKAKVCHLTFQWRKGHIINCYFWMINLKAINRKDTQHIKDLDVPYGIRLIPHIPNLPVLEPDGNMEYSADPERSDMIVLAGHDVYNPEEDDKPVPLTQAELNDIKRDTYTFRRSLFSCWVHVSKWNICWHQEQHSTGFETMRKK